LQLTTESTNIAQHLERIQQGIDDLEEAGVASDNAALLRLETRLNDFVNCQNLIEDSVKAAEKNDSFEASYGNLLVDTHGVAFEGFANVQSFKRVTLNFKDTRVSSGAWSMRAFVDPEVLKSFIETAAIGTVEEQERQGTASGEDAQVSAESSDTCVDSYGERFVWDGNRLAIEGSGGRNLWADLGMATEGHACQHSSH
jgi:hypothetical protein